jgi:flagellar basal-body rod modification protein FlgD
MSASATVKDGKIVESASQSSLASSSSTSKSGSTYDKNTFLQLLVAEVKNQDPLEPSSNTEWVSQYATFSELESMQNMSASYDLSRASGVIGKTVVMKVTSDSGETSYVEGNVDYVTYESNKAYLSIAGSLYSMDDLYNVVDSNYLTAYNAASAWVTSLEALPKTDNLTLSDATNVNTLYTTYTGMSDYEKTFLSTDEVTAIKDAYAKIQTLKASSSSSSSSSTSSSSTTSA